MKKIFILILVFNLCACTDNKNLNFPNSTNYFSIPKETSNTNSNQTPTTNETPDTNSITNELSIEHLSDLTLHTKGDREFSKGNIKFIKSSENENIYTIKLFDNWYHNDIIFSKNQNDKFHATPYSYYLTYSLDNNNIGYIQFYSDTPLTNTAEIKQGFINTLANNEYDYINLTDKQNIINQIDTINIDNAQITSKTEFDASVPNKLYIVPTNMEIDINSYGNLVGLTYSDFGTLTGKQWIENYNAKENLGYVFAGGKPEKNIIPNDTQSVMHFSGQAFGQVMLHTEDDNGVATNDYMYIESDATLLLDKGTERITMNFSENPDTNKKWYDVSITKNAEDIRIDLTNGDKISQENTKYKFADAPVNKNTEYHHQDGIAWSPHDSILSNGWYRTEQINTNIEYYGDNNQISESVGTTGFLQQEWAPNSKADKELSFSASFGVKKNN